MALWFRVWGLILEIENTGVWNGLHAFGLGVLGCVLASVAVAFKMRAVPRKTLRRRAEICAHSQR